MMDFLHGTVTPKDWAVVAGVAGAIVLICVGFYFALYIPQTEAIVQAEEDNKLLLQQLQEARTIHKNIEELRREKGKMQELVNLFEKRLPDKTEIPKLLQQVEKLAADTSVRVELSRLPVTSDVRKETIPYKIVARGDFHQITTFINRLERYQRYLKVSGLKIEKEEQSVADATFTLSTYRFIQVQAEEPPEDAKSKKKPAKTGATEKAATS